MIEERSQGKPLPLKLERSVENTVNYNLTRVATSWGTSAGIGKSIVIVTDKLLEVSVDSPKSSDLCWGTTY